MSPFPIPRARNPAAISSTARRYWFHDQGGEPGLNERGRIAVRAGGFFQNLIKGTRPHSMHFTKNPRGFV
jgi:hypothetical protein